MRDVPSNVTSGGAGQHMGGDQKFLITQMLEEKLHRQLFQNCSCPAEDMKDTHKVRLNWQASPGLD